ncbi:MAG: ABC transporter permease [Oscillatoria sp. SIO1A7]|nr:ABC transporter permease [Oscillatoria sp. SIO1A7]
MNLPWLDKLSDINPQLFREIKGRFTPRNLGIAAALSLGGQLLLAIAFWGQLPFGKVTKPELSVYSKYCTGALEYTDKVHYHSDSYPCHFDGAGHFIINWQLWWLDIFLWLSFISVGVLLVASVYMLVSDLAKEEHRGTLNFIRLSPRSAQTVLLGKLLGVPILLYLAILLAMPLHLWAGMAARIPLAQILSYDALVAAACIFFSSAAMLFGLITAWLRGFQAWLGSGLVLFFLWISALKLDSYEAVDKTALDLINLFNPCFLLPYLISTLRGNLPTIENYFRCNDCWASWQWIFLPIGRSVIAVAILMLLNFALWTWWIWQGLSRRFPNPSATWLSKTLSYGFVASFEVVTLGLAMQSNSNWEDSLIWLLVLNLLFFLGLIAALSPHRQALQDWARYRAASASSHNAGVGFQWQDLIWGEKSPAPVAIALNLLFTSALIGAWSLLFSTGGDRYQGLASLAINFTIICIYAVLAQILLLMKSKKRAIWATVVIGGLAFLPPVILGMLSIQPRDNSFLWFFSGLPWLEVEHAAPSAFFSALLIQLSILGWLSFLLIRKLNRAGESASKAILSRQEF